jgi:hypothetical protein
MNVSHPPRSTRRDAIMFYASHYEPGLHLALASLVATGSRCRVVVFTSSLFAPTAQFVRLVRRARIELVRECDSRDGRSLVGHMLRYEYESLWLRSHRRTVDRVIHCDSYDVFFQGDPFQALVPRDRLLLIKEDLLIGGCDWNSKWLQRCYGNETWYLLRDVNVICTGLIAGNAGEYLRLITLLTEQEQWQTCWESSKDQPIFNYLHGMGILEAQGFMFEYTDCWHGVFTMHWCQQQKPILFNEDGQLVTPRGDVPWLLHQYNRYQKVINRLAQSCNVTPWAQM